MKRTCKLLALVLAVVMLLGIAIPASAMMLPDIGDTPSKNPISSVTITGNPIVHSGDEATYTANVNGGTEPYTYYWDVQGPAHITSAREGRDVNQVSVFVDGEGEISITVQVVDANEQSDRGFLTVTGTGSGVTQPPPPAPVITVENPITFTYISGNTEVYATNSATYTANLTGGTEPYTYYWDVQGPAHFTSAREGREVNQVTLYFDGPGEVNLAVQVTDAQENTGKAFTTITAYSATPVQPVGAPYINSVTVSGKTSMYAAEEATFTAYVNGGTEPYTFYWDVQGPAHFTSAREGRSVDQVTIYAESEGAINLAVQVVDTNGNSDKGFISISAVNPTVPQPPVTVGPPQPPVTVTGPTPYPSKVCHTLQSFVVNGVTVPTIEVYSVNDENYFKLRDLAYLLNGTSSQFAVGYNAATTAITLTSGSPYTAVGGELSGAAYVANIWDVPNVEISSSPVTIDGVTVGMYAYRFQVSEWAWNNFYRLKDLAAYLGFNYSYDLDTNTVTITSR